MVNQMNHLIGWWTHSQTYAVYSVLHEFKWRIIPKFINHILQLSDNAWILDNKRREIEKTMSIQLKKQKGVSSWKEEKEEIVGVVKEEKEKRLVDYMYALCQAKWKALVVKLIKWHTNSLIESSKGLLTVPLISTKKVFGRFVCIIIFLLQTNLNIISDKTCQYQ